MIKCSRLKKTERRKEERKLGSILPNFICQAKRRQRTAFGKIFVLQFLQQNLSPLCVLKFVKIKAVCHSPQFVR